MGVAHGTDMSIWWFGNHWGNGLQEEEKATARKMVEPLGKFLWGDGDIGWATTSIDEVRMVLEDGQTVEIRVDQRWEEGKERWASVVSGKQSRL
jgi:hypothetical protein